MAHGGEHARCALLASQQEGTLPERGSFPGSPSLSSQVSRKAWDVQVHCTRLP
jgi:hypothetical protein